MLIPKLNYAPHLFSPQTFFSSLGRFSKKLVFGNNFSIDGNYHRTEMHLHLSSSSWEHLPFSTLSSCWPHALGGILPYPGWVPHMMCWKSEIPSMLLGKQSNRRGIDARPISEAKIAWWSNGRGDCSCVVEAKQKSRAATRGSASVLGWHHFHVTILTAHRHSMTVGSACNWYLAMSRITIPLLHFNECVPLA